MMIGDNPENWDENAWKELYEHEVSNFKAREVKLPEINEALNNEVENRCHIRIRDVPP